MRRIHTTVQREKVERKNLIASHKRHRVLEAFSSLDARNAKQNNANIHQQCVVRARTIQTQESRREAYELLSKVVHVDPLKLDGNEEQLVRIIQALNNQFNLGLKLKESHKSKYSSTNKLNK